MVGVDPRVNMADFEDWSRRRPALQYRPSQASSIQSSVARKPVTPSAMAATAPHRRTTSDNVSISSLSQADDTVGFSRQISAVSAQSRSWLPIQGMAPSTPPKETMEGIDLGSPDVNASFGAYAQAGPQDGSLPNERIPTFDQSPSVPAYPRRPKPTPFQFEDNVEYGSPLDSYRSTFSPQSQFKHNRTDSQAHLINTPTASDWTRTPASPPTTSPGLPRRKAWWKWRRAWVMYLFLLFGFCCAVGHHLFYAALDGRPADNQIAMLRYGTVLAFAAKAGFAAAIVTAYKQRIWATVRNKLLSVGALDTLFAATDDLSALWNIEAYQRAKLAMVLAVVVW